MAAPVTVATYAPAVGQDVCVVGVERVSVVAMRFASVLRGYAHTAQRIGSLGDDAAIAEAHFAPEA
jgi:hypothetical protein